MKRLCWIVFILFFYYSRSNASCVGVETLNATSGTFDDGSGNSNYPNGVNCGWIIEPEGANYVQLNITSFVTESGSDFVTIYDGTNSSGPVVSGPFSGNPTNIPIIYSKTSSMYVAFKSDTTNNYAGWSMSYGGEQGTAPTCSGLIYCTGNNSGSLSDGSGSDNYSNNLDCEWSITVSSGVVNISFTSFNTQDGDVLTIYDGSTNNSPVLASLSGNDAALTYFIFSTSTSVFIRFTSDASGSASGWSFDWKNTPGPQPTCGGLYQLTTSVGVVTDGSGGASYTNNLYCQWLVQPQGAQFIEFDLVAFSTEAGLDTVTLYDGPSTAYPVIEGPLSGSIAPGAIPPFFSTGNSVLVVFHTDNSDTSSGWSFDYQARVGVVPTCGGSQAYNSNTGSISDGSGAADYTNNLDCLWSISITTGVVNISFTALDTLPGDVITFYDGSSTLSPVLANISGNAPPTYFIFSTGSKVLIQFTSDASGVGAGWSLNWQSVASPQPTCGGVYDVTAPSGSVSDGSGAASYTNNLYCQWLVEPRGADYVQFDLVSFATESHTDTVTFYDGPTTNSTIFQGPLSGSLAAGNVPPFFSSVNTVLIVFQTDSSQTDSGWTFNYLPRNGTQPTCGGKTTVSSNTGSISDGSGTKNYTNNLDCTWYLSVSSGVFNISFSELDVLPGDRVIIYDGSTTNAAVLASLSGNTPPTYFIFSSGSNVVVEFITDASGVAAGWTLNWKNTPSPQPTCGGVYQVTAPSGTITDGSGNAAYTNNLNCQWLVAPKEADYIQFDLVSFTTEANLDYVTFYDGPTTNSTILQGPLSGSFTEGVIPPFFSTGNTVLIVFHTDNSDTASGWSFDYQTKTGSVPTCGGRSTISSNTGSISDGSGTANYTNNLDCEWSLSVTSGVMNISFTEFDTQPGDVVVIYDGSSITAPILANLSGLFSTPSEAHFTGNSPPTYFIFSTGLSVLIQFTSDASGVGAGWSLNWMSTPSPQPTCGGQYPVTNATGVVSDGSGAASYTNNLYCQWLVQPQGAQFIEFDLVSFVTEASYDTVTFYDGPTTSSPVIQGPLSGILAAGVVPSFFSTTNTALIVFQTDNRDTETGWSFNYQARNGSVPTCGGRQSVTANTGTLSDGSGAVSYTDNLDCTWYLSVTSGVFNITFSELDVLPGDSVTIYDGSSTNGQVLASLSGNSVPTYFIFSSGLNVVVQFVTDGSGVAAGWTLNWKSVASPAPTCGGLYQVTAPSGTVSDGSGNAAYTNNLNCQWVVSPQGADYIQFDLTSFTTEISVDYVTFYDGPTTAYPILQGPLSGVISEGVIPSFFSTGNSVLIVFHTDNSDVFGGWSFDYEARTGAEPTCGGRTVMSSNTGSISDGSGTGNYTDNLACQWLLSVSSGVFNISFSSFDTQPSDLVVIYDGSSITAPIIAILSGSEAITYFIFSSGATVLVSFTSDASGVGAGWSMDWKSIAAPAPTCGGLYPENSSSGFVSDGSGAAPYTNNLNCQWLVEPPGASAIHFTMLSFATEPNHDTVTFYNGPTTAYPVLAGPYSGSYSSNFPNFFAPGGAVLIVFHTDSTDTNNGWSFAYNSTILASSSPVPSQSASPSASSSVSPSAVPSTEPSASQSPGSSVSPTSSPSALPSITPTRTPSPSSSPAHIQPSFVPSITKLPSSSPDPTFAPSISHLPVPSNSPVPSSSPSPVPSTVPSMVPSTPTEPSFSPIASASSSPESGGNAKKDDDGPSAGVIAAITVPIVFVVAAGAVGAFVIFRRLRRRGAPRIANAEYENEGRGLLGGNQPDAPYGSI